MKNTAFIHFEVKKLVLLMLVVFCSSLSAQAQTSNEDWTFVYSDGWPHMVWRCPYSFCTGDELGGDPSPETKIAYASNGYTYTSSGFIYNLDRNLFATLTGGRLMGGNYETQSCVFGMYGYGTAHGDGVGGNCAHSVNTVAANFSQPVLGSRIYLRGKYPQRLIITESGQAPAYIDLDTTYNDQGEPTTIGVGTYILSGRKITGLTIKSMDANYAFSIDSIVVNKVSSSSPEASSTPPDYCNATPITRPAPENLSGYDWTMHAEVSDRDGLVISNVRLKGRLMAERISVPYYQIKTSNAPSIRGELRPDDSDGVLRSRLVYYKTDIDDERLIVTATYAIDNIPESQGCLSIIQRYEFLKSEYGAVCAPDPTGGHFSPCSRWRAMVSYDFRGNGETLQSLNVAQRNHFRVNNVAKNSVGLFRDCETAPDFGGCVPFGDRFFARKLNPLYSEFHTVVAVNSKDAGVWDNFHQTYRSAVSEPLNLSTVRSRFTVGGCPECVHSHWRWGKHSGGTFGNGNLLFPADTEQDLSVGIVRYHPGEEHPSSLFDLISFTNPEKIRSALTDIEFPEPDYYESTGPEEVVYWLSATGKNRSSDGFFSYYSFFNTNEPNTARPISPDTLQLQQSLSQGETATESKSSSDKLEAYNGFFNTDKSTISKSASPDGPYVRQGASQGQTSSLTNQDAPTSINYGHLYKDGATIYTERDPNTVAQLPEGYVLYNGVSYDIRTGAAVSGPHTISFNLPSVTDQATFDSLRVLHSEPHPFDPTGAIWVDRTVLSPNSPSPDFTNRYISAKANEVGPFVIARLVYTPPPNTNVADLSVSIIDASDPVTAGDDLIYTINIANNGPHTATGVALSNGLSPDVSFVSASAGQVSCNEINGIVRCDLGTVASGATIPVTITVKPNEGQTRFPTKGKALTNVAFIRANESDPDQSNNSDTESTNALPNPNAPPTVQIQSPAVDALLAGPATFSVIVGATDSDGTIAQVELFDNGKSVGNGAFIETGKYSIARTDVAYGEHSLIAIATDSGGRKAVSDRVEVFVNGPALVSLDSPTENSLFARPANVALTATAINDAGSISQVEFLANGQPIGNGVLTGTNQYNLTWSNAPTGIISLRAIATDGNGVKSYSDSTKIYVTNAPVVNIVSPVAGTSYAKHSNINFIANARDFDGYVSKVEFFANGTTLLGTGTLTQGESYAFTWADAQAGTVAITALATDDWGQTSISLPVSVTVTNAAPSVTMTGPTNGTIFTAPANITLSANASDSDGTITKVEFFKGTTLIGTILDPPYSFPWMNVAAGSYSLIAKATDDDGISTTSSTVSVTVNPVGSALFVVGSTTLSAVDNAIKTRLQNLGLTVVIKSATSATSADATGKRVVVISDSVTPTNVNTKFRTVTVPVVTLSSQLFDDMGMCATTTTNFGTATSQKNVTITNAGHSMAAGLSGTVQIVASNTTFGWGKINANGIKIATLTTDSTKATNFGYEANAVMPGLTAPKRRVGFFYTAASSSLTASGGVLFDSAIKWAAGL